MKIKKLSIKNVRKFNKDVEYNFCKNTLVLGENATGKTTILESICVLSTTRSPKTTNSNEMIAFGKEEMVVSGIIESKKGTQNIEIRRIFDKNKITLNKKTLLKNSELIGCFDVVYFQPNESYEFQSGPVYRRKVFDVVFCQLSNEYMRELKLYKKVVKMRNSALKQANLSKKEEDVKVVDSFSDYLLSSGKRIIELRKIFVEEINKLIFKIHYNFSSEETLTLKYTPNVELENYEKCLKQNQMKDIVCETTSNGPHRDDFCFLLNNKDVTKYCSQGQQKSVHLSFKLTLVEIFKKIKKEYPVLILDDALSDLDTQRQNALFNMVNDEVQLFISTNHISEIKQENIQKFEIIKLEKEMLSNE